MRKMMGLCVAGLLLAALLCHAQAAPNRAALGMTLTKMDPAKQKDWLARWDKALVKDVKGFPVCESVLGEDLGFVMTPAMDSFYYGYMATKDPKYVDMLVDWTDVLIKRAVKEPDGYVGWPCLKAAGTDVDNLDNTYNADSMLGEAMVFRPIVQMAREMTTDPALKEKYGAKGESYVKFAERLYAKWAERGGWRPSGEGGLISLVLPYGWTRPTRSGLTTIRGTPPAADSRTRTTRPTRSRAGCSRCGMRRASPNTRSMRRNGSR